nr:E3 ubiquitin-protein ligase listerin [Ipomoea batatas]GME12295.1 E3 ubiquitin-protein ligase listerin [Ipomoea batatas]GME12863.1 E3 ubiquitin-protein ligase listerin [Ipomoea batatas]GME16552.1 E3 ubiquitin-protein ligase listerin [Ipomoea batatas]
MSSSATKKALVFNIQWQCGKSDGRRRSQAPRPTTKLAADAADASHPPLMKPTDDDEAKADDAASFPHLRICESSSLLICDLCSALFPMILPDSCSCLLSSLSWFALLPSFSFVKFRRPAAEAIASSYCAEAYSIITFSRLYHSKFWDLVASHVVKSSSHVRKKAVKSVEIWGLSKGPINSRFVLLFSRKPLPSLQFVAYAILSTEPVSHLAFGTLRKESSSDEDASNNQDYRSPEPFAEENIHLREEISSKLENFPTEVLEMDLLNGSVAYVYISPHLLSTLYSYYLRGNARMQHVPSLAVQLFLLLNIVGLQMPSEHRC